MGRHGLDAPAVVRAAEALLGIRLDVSREALSGEEVGVRSDERVEDL
jgi:hypothetical protein